TASASMSIGSVAGQYGGTVTVNDPSNHVWIIQASSNLSTWSEVATWKVFNGNYHSTVDYQLAGPFGFYRAFFDPSRQNIPDTTAAALLLPDTPFNYANPPLPKNYLVPPISLEDNTPTNNPVTDFGAMLGRVLFYDKRLSTNQTISCASCHQQQH